ncbi:MAG: hypothetical protein IH587_06190, partial [Anaerolineae bacterium]|nr:hypothetical protein [Anaerolineae bacterium]
AAVAGSPVEEVMTAANDEVSNIVQDAGYYDNGAHYVSVEEREQFVCELFAQLNLESPEC